MEIKVSGDYYAFDIDYNGVGYSLTQMDGVWLICLNGNDLLRFRTKTPKKAVIKAIQWIMDNGLVNEINEINNKFIFEVKQNDKEN